MCTTPHSTLHVCHDTLTLDVYLVTLTHFTCTMKHSDVYHGTYLAQTVASEIRISERSETLNPESEPESESVKELTSNHKLSFTASRCGSQVTLRSQKLTYGDMQVA